MGRKFLVIYDYFIVESSGLEHFGINYILINFLSKNSLDYKVLKMKFNFSLEKILFEKIPSIYNQITKNNFTDVICYNNLNCIIVCILKKIFKKKFKIIFVSLDFSKKRFGNFILDNIYVLIDFLASKLSDETWSCSYRIYEYRKNFLSSDKNYFVPNIPNYVKLGLKKFENFTIVMTSFLHENYMFEEVFKIFEFIKNQNINLYIIGEGNMKGAINKEIISKGLEKNVILTGYLEHDEVKKILEKSHLGLALYSGKSDINLWGDSLKIREYTYYNIPVITTNIVSNHKEIIEKNLGLVINKERNLLKCVIEIYNNKKLYSNILNSIKDYNTKVSIDKILKERILDSVV